MEPGAALSTSTSVSGDCQPGRSNKSLSTFELPLTDLPVTSEGEFGEAVSRMRAIHSRGYIPGHGAAWNVWDAFADFHGFNPDDPTGTAHLGVTFPTPRGIHLAETTGMARATRAREAGNESVVVLFWLPILFVLLVGLVEVGLMFGSRAAINDVLRDSARGMAAYGADCPTPDPIPGSAKCFSRQAEQRLYQGGDCTFGFCAGRPRVTCTAEDGTTSVKFARTIVTCEVTGKYPYRAISASLLDSPLGLGLGGLVGPFSASASAVAEVGTEGVIGIR